MNKLKEAEMQLVQDAESGDKTVLRSLRQFAERHMEELFDRLSDGAFYQACFTRGTGEPDLDHARALAEALRQRWGCVADIKQRNHRVEVRLIPLSDCA